jgi:hypothetical protein
MNNSNDVNNVETKVPSIHYLVVRYPETLEDAIALKCALDAGLFSCIFRSNFLGSAGFEFKGLDFTNEEHCRIAEDKMIKQNELYKFDRWPQISKVGITKALNWRDISRDNIIGFINKMFNDEINGLPEGIRIPVFNEFKSCYELTGKKWNSVFLGRKINGLKARYSNYKKDGKGGKGGKGGTKAASPEEMANAKVLIAAKEKANKKEKTYSIPQEKTEGLSNKEIKKESKTVGGKKPKSPKKLEGSFADVGDAIKKEVAKAVSMPVHSYDKNAGARIIVYLDGNNEYCVSYFDDEGAVMEDMNKVSGSYLPLDESDYRSWVNNKKNVMSVNNFLTKVCK